MIRNMVRKADLIGLAYLGHSRDVIIRERG